jgi:enamine deaminase RidA (YjgF/YER057c/UK114 family)
MSTLDQYIQYSSFITDTGAQESYLVLATHDDHATFADAFTELEQLWSEALTCYGLSSDMLVFSRLFLSDIENQKEAVRANRFLQTLKNGCVSVVQQPPLGGGPVRLLAYFVKKTDGSGLTRSALNFDEATWVNSGLFAGDSFPMHWMANFADSSVADPRLQTENLFTAYTDLLTAHKMTLLNNGVRTWVFVRDIDNNYLDMVKARRDFFQAHGLTGETRFLASTGIEGDGPITGTFVNMDALAFGGLSPDQIIKMEAQRNMPPTLRYGVTFERGLRIRFGDRSHLYVSGTASINQAGEVMYHGDTRRQTERTLESIEALLAVHDAGLKDFAYLIVYLRDPVFYTSVMGVVRQRIDANIPVLVVASAVCRPAWLVEMEGVAIIKDQSDFAAFL